MFVTAIIIKLNMENQVQSSSFYKVRGFLRRLSEGFDFVTNDLSGLLRSSLYIVLPTALIVALLSCSITDFSAASFEANTSLLWIGIIDLFVLFVGFLFFMSLCFTMVQQLAEQGTMPHYKMKYWAKLSLGNVTKVLSFFVTFAILACIVFGLSLWLSFATSQFFWALIGYVLLFLLYIFMVMMPYSLVIGKKPYFVALRESFAWGGRHFSSTFGIVLLTGIIIMIIRLIANIPVYVIMAVNSASAEGFIGEGGEVPGYFVLLQFMVVFLTVLINMWTQFVMVGPLAYQYANIISEDKSDEIRAAEIENQ